MGRRAYLIVGFVLLLPLAPLTPAAAELDTCSGGGGSALMFDDRAGYGLDTVKADILVHTGAVCNSVNSFGNATFTYTSIDDTFGHYANAGYRRHYGSSIYLASHYSWNDSTGYRNQVDMYEGISVGSVYNSGFLR